MGKLDKILDQVFKSDILSIKCVLFLCHILIKATALKTINFLQKSTIQI